MKFLFPNSFNNSHQRSVLRINYLVLLLITVSCTDEKTIPETAKESFQTPQANTLAQKQDLSPQTDTTAMVEVNPEPVVEQDWIDISFCGYFKLENEQRFKIYDWDSNEVQWLYVGDTYRGFGVVGLNDASDVRELVLEKDEFYYQYAFENLQLDRKPSDGTRVEILSAKDVPEGADLMEYISTHTKPLNEWEMPENQPVLNPDVKME